MQIIGTKGLFYTQPAPATQPKPQAQTQPDSSTVPARDNEERGTSAMPSGNSVASEPTNPSPSEPSTPPVEAASTPAPASTSSKTVNSSESDAVSSPNSIAMPQPSAGTSGSSQSDSASTGSMRNMESDRNDVSSMPDEIRDNAIARASGAGTQIRLLKPGASSLTELTDLSMIEDTKTNIFQNAAQTLMAQATFTNQAALTVLSDRPSAST